MPQRVEYPTGIVRHSRHKRSDPRAKQLCVVRLGLPRDRGRTATQAVEMKLTHYPCLTQPQAPAKFGVRLFDEKDWFPTRFRPPESPPGLTQGRMEFENHEKARLC